MSSRMEEPTVGQRAKYSDMINAVLGWLGAVNLLLLAFYILGVYLSVSAIDATVKERLLFHVYLVTILTAASATVLVYGSYLIWKTRRLKGGIVNLLAGTIVPIPTYLYFSFLSQPPLLFWLFDWLGLVGCFLLIPAITSGIASIYLSKFHT